MPADLRAHARYPEVLFRVQAEIYRTYHMRDAEAFYNKEDLWDIAKNAYNQNPDNDRNSSPFVVATLPGEAKPEFLLMQSFTPRSRDNLIGVMIGRCDGDKLGELEVLQLSKQNLIYGPLQIEAKIDSDQNIVKDLSLWNQQGSKVIRGEMLVLPLDDTFLYVEPIYIQSAQTRLPQLKKVVLAIGNTLVYRDTYEQAVAELAALSTGTAAPQVQTTQTQQMGEPPGKPAAAPTTPEDTTLTQVRDRLRRYRDLSAQGKWSEAGRELEAIEALVKNK
jgi:uncharacterized membrane protein (UPF0182 family)